MVLEESIDVDRVFVRYVVTAMTRVRSSFSSYRELLEMY